MRRWDGCGDPGDGEHRRVRLAGLLVDQEFGLLIYAPFLVLVPLGIAVMRHRSVARAVIFACVCYLAPVLWVVHQRPRLAGRLEPRRPLHAAAGAAGCADPARGIRRMPRAVLIVLLALQIFLNAYLWQNPKNLWNDGDGVAAICSRSASGLCRWLPKIRGGGPS